MTLKAVQNWSSIELKSTEAINVLGLAIPNPEQAGAYCTNSGYIFGKLMKQIIETEIDVGKVANEAANKIA